MNGGRCTNTDTPLDSAIIAGLKAGKAGPRTLATMERCERLVRAWRERKAADAAAERKATSA